MPPTEAAILASFLLPPAPLTNAISRKAFTDLFPKAQQSSPEIKTLYQDLQHQRAQLIDAVERNIAAEVRRGVAQRRAVVRARRAAEKQEQDDEVDVESVLYGSTSNLPSSKSHSLNSIIPEMESAVEDVEDEIRRLDQEADELMKEMQNTVGGLSDLRYGRLANSQLREQVLDGLGRLQEACESR